MSQDQRSYVAADMCAVLPMFKAACGGHGSATCRHAFYDDAVPVASTKRPIDALVGEWAAPIFKANGFKRQHRVFRAAGEHGIHLRIEFRLFPLPVRCDTFWFEWTEPTSPDGHGNLAGRVPIPPPMCLDRDFNAVFPPEYLLTHEDLWRVSDSTVDTYGPLLAQQVDRFMPHWRQVLAHSSTGPSSALQALDNERRLPRSATASAVATAVVAGRANSVADEIREVGTDHPDNVWATWWQGLLTKS